MMFREDYRKLMDSVSPSDTLEQRTEREIIEMLNPRIKKNLRRTACIAVAAIILALGAAFAAVAASGILERLFPNGEPTQQALEAVIRTPHAVSSEGVTLQIDEYLFDNNTLHMGWTVSSEREGSVFYTTDYEFSYASAADEDVASESVGGVYGGYSSGETGDCALVHLAPETPSYSGYAGYGYRNALLGSVNAHLTVRVYETDYGITDVENALDLIYANSGDPTGLALESAEKIGVGPDQMCAINSYACFNAALEELLDDGMEWDAARQAALVKSGVFRELTTLELDLDIAPGSAPEARFALDGERRYDLSDASVILKYLSADAASTIIEYEVITEKVFDEENIVGNGVSYILFDQDGNPLNSDYALGMSGGQLSDREGKHVWSISLTGNPLRENITSITFVPTCALERGENESSNAYFLRMRDQADVDQCFTIKIG